MDFSLFTLPDWAVLSEMPEVIGDLPEAVAAAAVSAVATLALMMGFGSRGGLGIRAVGEAEPAAALDCEFMIQGTAVKPMTEPARALLGGLDPGAGRLSALIAHVERDCQGFRSDLEALVLYGSPFRHHCQRRDGSAFEVAGRPKDGAAHLVIRAASEDARALRGAQGALERATAEGRLLRELLDRAPMLAWSAGPDGQVSWANAPYRERFGPVEAETADPRSGSAFGHVLEEVPLTTRGGAGRRRVAVPGSGSEPEWFEVTQSPGAEGETLGYALAADDLVSAEAALRRFVETLTETFAHLPIGLAVFDKNRRLGLFNPALTDLVKIDAVWLAGRPSLRDFLERLRETRQMPEQKDFTSWRRKLGELEEGAREGTYEENWVLPSGKIFRVTGRPHPQGALAFLFEDISTSILLERRYRSELELSQATLDRMAEAVAVFDTSGEIIFVNSAFEALWKLAPMDRLRGPGVAEMVRLCAASCVPSPAWAQLAEFAQAADTRTSWTASMTMLDRRELHLLVAPLPDASTLVVFRDLSAERARLGLPADEAALVGELALEQLRLPAENAIRHLTAAMPTAASPEALQALTSAAQGLREGLARAGALGDLGEGGAGPLPMLAAALERRALKLEVTSGARDWGPERRRLALALGLAAADLAAPGAALRLGDAAEGLRAEVEAAPRGAEGLAGAVLRRMAEAAGGGLIVSHEGDRAVLSLRLPSTGEAEAPMLLPAPVPRAS